MLQNRTRMISKLILETTPLFKNNSIMYLNKINFIYGENSTGKTALAEWISSLDNDERISRWRLKENNLPIILVAKFLNSKIDEVRICMKLNGITYYLNNQKSVVSPINYKFVFLRTLEYQLKHLLNIYRNSYELTNLN